MAEFPASAQTMVGNHIGSCLLHLTGAAITVRYTHGNDIASWPYNCIRQFRADEETRQFSFYSGRRGPYGVAEYKFDMTEEMLLSLQDALTQFTGAKFNSNTMSTSSLGNSGMTSPAREQQYTPDPFRTPKRDPLPEIPAAPPSNAEMFRGYMAHGSTDVRSLQNQQTHSATDLFATLPKDPRYRYSSVSAGKPPIPAPYDSSRTLDTRGRRGFAAPGTAPNTKYTYHEFAGPQGPKGGNSTSQVPSPKLSGNRKLSYGDDVFRANPASSPSRKPKLSRQTTEPNYRRMHGIEEGTVVSPPPDAMDGQVSDLDFGQLRRSSPQVDRKSIKKGRISPSEGRSSSSHELYSIPRPTLDNVTQSAAETFSQESPEGTTFTISPTETENVYNVPKSIGGNESDFYSSPRPQNQYGNDEVDTGYTGGTVIYNIPPARQPMVKPPDDDLYNTPKPAVMNGHELYNTPRSANGHDGYNPNPPPADGQETYNVPRAALESHLQQVDEGLYNVPRSVEGTPSDVYNVPKPSEIRNRKNYDSLELKQNGSTPHHDHQVPNKRGNSVRYPTINSRQRLPTPEQETYNVPRPSDSTPSHDRRGDGRYPYEYVDHRLPKETNGTLKSSHSFESLVHRRVNLSPDTPAQTRPLRTPSPRALNHRYIEIDLFDPPNASSQQSGQQQRPENVYAEIQDTDPNRRGSLPNTAIHSTSNPYATVPCNLKASAVNSSPAPNLSSGSVSVSKEARALHEDGYELVLPAEDTSRNQTLKQQVSTPPRSIGSVRKVTPSQSHSIQFSNSGGFSSVGNGSLTQLSSSGPLKPNPLTDEYVIVTRQDFNHSTHPRDIPVPLPQAGTTKISQAVNPLSTSVDPLQDEYEVMNAVKHQIHLDRIAGSGPKFQMVPPVPAKKGMANHANSTSQLEANRRQSMRDSMDLDSVESGSRVSVASSNQLEEVVGPLSPMETSMNSPLQIFPNKSTPNKSVVKIASGSPSDITPSRDLRRRTQSVGNMLDEEGMRPRKYENVTDRELAKQAQLASTQLSRGPKRPPMPLPRPARPEH